MMVHRYTCGDCGNSLDYLKKDDEFDCCPFCVSGNFEYDGVPGVVGSISDKEEARN